MFSLHDKQSPISTPPRKRLRGEGEAGAEQNDVESLVQLKRQKLLEETAKADDLEAKATALEAEAATLQGRINIRKKLKLIDRAKGIRKKVQDLRSGKELKTFESKTQRYVEAQRVIRAKEIARARQCPPPLVSPSLQSPTKKPRKNSPAARNAKAEAAKASETNLLMREYRAEFENGAPPMNITLQDLCKSCNEPLLLSISGAMLVCRKCHCEYPYIDTTAASIAYGDEFEFSSVTYKKVHHFDDWLKKFQAISTKEVERPVMEATMTHIVDVQGIRDKNLIKKEDVRKALKALNLRKYYDHDMQIFCRITGKLPPSMSPSQLAMCKKMFSAIQNPFIKWKNIVDPRRRNFLSYSYVLYKICELKGWTSFLPHFNLLKGKEKLRRQDLIWRGVSHEMGWEFKSSDRREMYPQMDNI